MSGKKEKNTPEETTVDANEIETLVNIDTAAIELMEKKIEEKVESMKDKLYSIKMTKKLLTAFEVFISENARWNGKEALGIIEIDNVLKKAKLEGGYIYMESLPLQASHYFLSREGGKGLKEAVEYMKLFKAFDEGLERSRHDADALKSLQKELAGLQQGMVSE